MKLIHQKATLITQTKYNLQGIYEQIELAGRTCYKSTPSYDAEGNSTTAEKFVERMIDAKHTAMLEHGTVCLDIALGSPLSDTYYFSKMDFISFFKKNPYSKVIEYKNSVEVDSTLIDVVHYAITTNYRVIIENHMQNVLEYLCDPTVYHPKRQAFRLITSIGITRELNRHRTHSIAEQSTRYCNYSNDKFGNRLTFIEPNWEMETIPRSEWLDCIQKAEESYLELINSGWKPQQAREVLPLCLATEIVHTAFESDWVHFFNLRYFETTGKVHPNMKELAEQMYKLWNI